MSEKLQLRLLIIDKKMNTINLTLTGDKIEKFMKIFEADILNGKPHKGKKELNQEVKEYLEGFGKW